MKPSIQLIVAGLLTACVGIILQLETKNRAMSQEIDNLIVEYNACTWEQDGKVMNSQNQEFWDKFFAQKKP